MARILTVLPDSKAIAAYLSLFRQPLIFINQSRQRKNAGKHKFIYGAII